MIILIVFVVLLALVLVLSIVLNLLDDKRKVAQGYDSTTGVVVVSRDVLVDNGEVNLMVVYKVDGIRYCLIKDNGFFLVHQEDHVKVVYDSNNPEVSDLSGEYYATENLIEFVYFLVLAVVVLVVVMWMR